VFDCKIKSREEEEEEREERIGTKNDD